MMWIPVVITLVVVFIIAAAFMSQRDKDPEDLFLLVASTVYITGLSLGFLVTGFATPTLDTWPWAIGVRVIWQLGGTVLILVFILRFAIRNGNAGKRSVWVLTGLAAALGLAAAYNPLRDLVSGPQVLRVTDFDKKLTRNLKSPTSRIFITLKAITPDGQPREIHLAGWSADTADDLLGRCGSTTGATVTVLVHVGNVLAAKCP